ncbi:MAG: hypothetical protein GY943_32005, partial [Chloroflexi bacterium]|nr:hypothetical protein [Chloroflexota bacterium]
MAFVVFPERDAVRGRADVTIWAQPLLANGQIDRAKAPRELLREPDPPGCVTDSLYSAPDGRFLLIQYNCESTLFVRLLSITGEPLPPVTMPAAYFLDWSPAGDYLLLKDMDADQVILLATNEIKANRRNRQVIDLPEGTYSAVFAPDGAQLHYAADRGLGFGTEHGIFDLAKNQLVARVEFPRHVIGTPRWSPDGDQLAYVQMPDSNIPFTVGELWLADENGSADTLLGEADAGHGYAPMWSPDGRSLLFVQRENVDSPLADHVANALHSNLYVADINTRLVTPLTSFKESLVNLPAWSEDGKRIAFAADDAVWAVELTGGEPVQISPT